MTPPPPDGAGVVTSRDPHTGAAGTHVCWWPGSTEFPDPGAGCDGDGVHGPLAVVADDWPGAATRLLAAAATDATVRARHLAAVPFVVTAGELELGAPGPSPRTALAAVRLAVALHDDDEVGLSPAEAVVSVHPDDIAALVHPHRTDIPATVVARGTGTSPGVGVGVLCTTTDDAVAAAGDGHGVVLALTTTTMADEPAMRVAAAVVTTTGGLTSHAAVLARAWGIPAVCAPQAAAGPDGAAGATVLAVRPDGLVAPDGTVVVAAGTVVTVDGTAGEVLDGDCGVPDVVAPPELDRLLAWADRLTAGRVEVVANADTADEVALARDFGARGVGLCRTEHHFVGERVNVVRAVLAAQTADAQRVALDELAAVQASQLVAVLAAAGDLPVTVRLLDPPLHEFLPSLTELLAAQATAVVPDEALDALAAAHRWREHNPMLGTRGVRLEVMQAGVYAAQCRALAAAVAERTAAGAHPRVRIVLPMIATAAEFASVAATVRAVWAEATGGGSVEVGAMVETPRAALVAGELASVADFVALGTNDLTQLTFGFSRDDLAGLLQRYVAGGLLDADPFVTLDHPGVGRLVSLAVESVRQVAPAAGISACGEHASDAASVAALVGWGVTTLSCAPYRVQVARLAAAHAVVGVPPAVAATVRHPE